MQRYHIYIIIITALISPNPTHNAINALKTQNLKPPHDPANPHLQVLPITPPIVIEKSINIIETKTVEISINAYKRSIIEYGFLFEI